MYNHTTEAKQTIVKIIAQESILQRIPLELYSHFDCPPSMSYAYFNDDSC